MQGKSIQSVTILSVFCLQVRKRLSFNLIMEHFLSLESCVTEHQGVHLISITHIIQRHWFLLLTVTLLPFCIELSFSHGAVAKALLGVNQPSVDSPHSNSVTYLPPWGKCQEGDSFVYEGI